MGINIIKGEIKIIIDTLYEQYAVINQRSGKIPQIELDIMMANIRRLYERLYDLNKLNSADHKTISEEIPEIIAEIEEVATENLFVEPVVEEKVEAAMEPAMEQKEVEIEEIEITFAEKEIIPEEIKEEVVEVVTPEVNLEKTKEIIFDLNDVQKEEIETTVVEEEKIVPPVETVKPAKSGKKEGVDLFSLAEKETLADKFKETPKSMHDKIANEKPDKTLADMIGKAAITNLKNAIGINDKFLFINELFKGDIQEYNKTIDKLNSYEKLDETTGILEELKDKYKWSEKPEAYHKLEDLLIRKFL